MGVLLATSNRSNLDISTPQVLLGYTNASPNPLLVLIRVMISSIAGSGLYQISAYINNKLILPEYPAAVGEYDAFVAQTAPLLVAAGERLTVQAMGQLVDTNATCVTHVVDNGLSHSDLRAINNTIINTKTRIVLGPQPRQVVTFLLPISKP